MTQVLGGTQKIIVNSPSSVSVVKAGPIGPPGLGGSGFMIPFGSDGPITVKNGKWDIPISENYRLKRIRGRILTNVPIGGDLVVNLNVTLPTDPDTRISVWNDPADYLRIPDGYSDSGPIETFDLSDFPANSLVGPVDVVSVPPNTIYDLIVVVELAKFS